MLSHLAALALAVYAMRTSGVRTEVLLYAFIIDYAFRLFTVRTFHAWLQPESGDRLHNAAAFLSRRPAKGQKPEKLVDQNSGRPLGIVAYGFVMATLFYFAFVLANVNAEGEFGSTRSAILSDLNAAVIVAAIYWVNALLTRELMINPNQSLVDNLGYNNRVIGLLAASILVGGVVFLVRKKMGAPASAWTVMGPLLVWRTIIDLRARLHASPRARPIPNLSPRRL